MLFNSMPCCVGLYHAFIQVAWCRSKAQYMGRKLVTAMKDKLGKQLFEVVIQASANGDVVARETIKVPACSHLVQLQCSLSLNADRPFG